MWQSYKENTQNLSSSYVLMWKGVNDKKNVIDTNGIFEKLPKDHLA